MTRKTDKMRLTLQGAMTVSAVEYAAAFGEPNPTTSEINAAMKRVSPYGEWCRDPKLCAGKGYCPRDPTCGD